MSRFQQIIAAADRVLAAQAEEQLISTAATEKFGEVLNIRPTTKGGHVLLIRRAEPANEDVPYMTIRSVVNPKEHGGAVVFNWGRYDMNESDAKDDFATR